MIATSSKSHQTTSNQNSRASTDLTELAASANKHHHAVESHLGQAVRSAKRAGDALRRVRKRVGHGNFTKWLEANFESSPETARVYMRISKEWKDIKAHLGKEPMLSIEGAMKLLRVQRHADDPARVIDRYIRWCKRGLLNEIGRFFQDDECVFLYTYCAAFSDDLHNWLTRIRNRIGPLVTPVVAADRKLYLERHDLIEQECEDNSPEWDAAHARFQRRVTRAFEGATGLTKFQRKKLREIIGQTAQPTGRFDEYRAYCSEEREKGAESVEELVDPAVLPHRTDHVVACERS